MEREVKEQVVEVGNVKLTFDLNRIEGTVKIEVYYEQKGMTHLVLAPVVDLVRAISAMGGAYMTEVHETLSPFFDETPEEGPYTGGKPDEVSAGDVAPRAKHYLYPEGFDEVPANTPRRLGLSPEEAAEGA